MSGRKDAGGKTEVGKAKWTSTASFFISNGKFAIFQNQLKDTGAGDKALQLVRESGLSLSKLV